MFRGHEEATERAPDAKILSSISGAHTLVQAWYLGHMASQNPSFRSLALWQDFAPWLLPLDGQLTNLRLRKLSHTL